MQDMAQAKFQMKFDYMFASVPIYDGTDPDTLSDRVTLQDESQGC